MLLTQEAHSIPSLEEGAGGADCGAHQGGLAWALVRQHSPHIRQHALACGQPRSLPLDPRVGAGPGLHSLGPTGTAGPWTHGFPETLAQLPFPTGGPTDLSTHCPAWGGLCSPSSHRAGAGGADSLVPPIGLGFSPAGCSASAGSGSQVSSHSWPWEPRKQA